MRTERAQLWVLPELGHLELLSATYHAQVFARHSHETYSIGMVEQGALAYAARGASHRVQPGFIGLINPDEAHTGHAGEPGGWTYRNLYPQPQLLSRLAQELSGREQLPYFPPVVHDPGLARELLAAHRLSESPASALERETRWSAALMRLIARHSQVRPHRPPGSAARAAHAAREMLEDERRRNVSLTELAQTLDVNAFTLLRAFARQFGLPPHAYQAQLRLRHARRCLRDGASLAGAAAEAGFADQSHLHRHFRRVYGLTPGQYARAVRNVQD